jgi:uncharacterized RDD family membrane protein YckC
MQPAGPALVTGEGVPLALAPAGAGSRVVAAVLDAVIQAVALFVLVLLDVVAAGHADAAAFDALVVVEIVLVLAGYPIVAEWLSRGRTVGKLVFGLRVVRDDSGPIGFRHALVRGLAGLILEKPGLLFPLTTIAGVLTMTSSAREKRLGDMLAGTVVLNENSAPKGLLPLPTWVPPYLQPWVLSLDMHRLDDRLALSARQFVARAHEMSPQARAALGEQLRRCVEAVISPPAPPNTPTPAVLVAVLVERRRRASSGTGAPASAAAPVPGARWPEQPTRPPQSGAPFTPPG